jgi:hypothetical protein
MKSNSIVFTVDMLNHTHNCYNKLNNQVKNKEEFNKLNENSLQQINLVMFVQTLNLISDLNIIILFVLLLIISIKNI